MAELIRSDLIDGLRRFEDEFNKDFSLRDIIEDLKNYITKADLKVINEKPNEQTIEKLFFFFIYIKKDVLPLINCLRNSYGWLHDAIFRSRGDKWISDYRKAIQDIPNNQDWNIHRTHYLWEIQKELKKLER